MREINTPWVRTVLMDPPSLQDNTADAERLIAALKEDLSANTVDIDLDLLKQLPALLRKWKYKVRCILFTFTAIII